MQKTVLSHSNLLVQLTTLLLHLFFFKTAFERGVSWPAIEMSPIIAGFLSSRFYYKNQTITIYQECRQKWQNGINTNLRSVIIRMKRKDDSAKWNMAFKHDKELFAAQERYIDVLDSNLVNLLKLTKKHGFLGDNVVGFLDDYDARGAKDAVSAQKRCCYSLYSLVDHLYFHHICFFFSTEKELKDALRLGAISPTVYATIYENAYNSIRNRFPTFRRGHTRERTCGSFPKQSMVFGVSQRFTLEPSDTAFANCCRAEIGLPTIAHSKKKREFEKTSGLKLFFGEPDVY